MDAMNRNNGGSKAMDIALQSLRTLHPVRQWECGIGFFQYLAALGTSGAGLFMLAARRPGAAELLVLAAVLWACVVVGGLLTIVVNEESPTDELRRELREVHDRSFTQAREVPHPQDQPTKPEGREEPWMTVPDAEQQRGNGHTTYT